MSHSFKRYPGGPVGGSAKAGDGRYWKRAKAKSERALAKSALAAGCYADFPFTPSATYDIGGDGKTSYWDMDPDDLVKAMRK